MAGPDRRAADSVHAILVGNGGPVSAVVDTELHTQFKQVGRPSINNWGAVAFMAVTTTSGYDTVAVANGGSILTIAGPGSPTSSVGPLTVRDRAGAQQQRRNGRHRARVSDVGLFSGNGGPLTTISLSNPECFQRHQRSRAGGIRSNSAGVQIGDGGPVRTVASVGTYQAFGGEAAINGASLVAFWARLASGADRHLHRSKSGH